MRARRTPTLAELPDIESRSRRDRRPGRRARRSKSKSWSIRQVSDERFASAAWANRTTFGRPTTGTRIALYPGHAEYLESSHLRRECQSDWPITREGDQEKPGKLTRPA